MTATPASQDAEARIERLEIRAAYQEQAIEDLNRAITAQWAQIESLSLQLRRLADRLSQIEHGDSSEPEPPPPHY